jgi:NTE family protein
MEQKTVAIACQGGGSQCAFGAGALSALFAEGVQNRYKIVGLSGTSGGALTAALAWVGLIEQARGNGTPIEDRIIRFWKDLSARTIQEMMFDQSCVQLMRLQERGFLPSFASSPSSAPFQFWAKTAGMFLGRPEFTDLRVLLTKHLNVENLPAALDPNSPVLLVGAADVLQGNFKLFSSALNQVNIDALLASAAIPNLFPAQMVDDHAYWDGIFSSNPPITGFLRRACMGGHIPPEEIWIIQVNRTASATIPEAPQDITDRRNHMAGNLSLQHELEMIEVVNMLLQEHALTDRFRARFGLETTEKITVRFIRMSEEKQAKLDYPSKLSRQPQFIDALIADGMAQAQSFLASLGMGERPTPPGAEERAIH